MSTHTHPVVRAYLARVRTALSDLPEAEIDEIVDDVRPHLAEIVEGMGERASVVAMTEELGTPESYAAEVRAAGEYPPPPAKEPARPGRSHRVFARLALWGLAAGTICAAVAGAVLASGVGDEALVLLYLAVMMVGASAGYVVLRGTAVVRELPEVRRCLTASRTRGGTTRVVRWMGALNPVWWGVCALFLGLLAVVTVVGPGFGVLGLVTLLALAGITLWAGPRSARDHRMAMVALPLSAFVVGGGVGMASFVLEAARGSDDAGYGGAYAYTASYSDADGDALLFYGSRPVENLYVFDSEGKPLTDVYVYDENGSPLRIPRYACDEHTQEKIQAGVDNRFPRPHIEQGGLDDHGIVGGYNVSRPFCEEVAEVPFTVAVPEGK